MKAKTKYSKLFLVFSLLAMILLVAACSADTVNDADVVAEQETIGEPERQDQSLEVTEEELIQLEVAQELQEDEPDIDAADVPEDVVGDQPYEGADEDPLADVITLESPLKASVLIGYDVLDQQGEEVGDIADLVINAESGQIRYAAIAYDDDLGLDEELFVVPISTFNFDHQQQTFFIDIDEEMLEDAPGLDDDSWPEIITQPEWDVEFEGYWNELSLDTAEINTAAEGQTVNREDTALQNMPVVLASQLLEYDLETTQNEALGEIEDLIINMSTEQVSYIVLSMDEELIGLRDVDHWYAVQWDQLSLTPEQAAFTLDASEATLESVPVFAEEQWDQSRIDLTVEELGSVAD